MATLVNRDRQTQRQRDRQSCRGPSASQQQSYGGGRHEGRQSSLGLFLPLECADNPNEGQAVPPIPGLFPSPFHIRLQFKERPNRGKGERGRAWVTHHAGDPRHLKADQKSKQGAPLTRELVSVARCNASVTSTRVGGSLEAWITWVREKGSVTARSQGPRAT